MLSSTYISRSFSSNPGMYIVNATFTYKLKHMFILTAVQFDSFKGAFYISNITQCTLNNTYATF